MPNAVIVEIERKSAERQGAELTKQATSILSIYGQIVFSARRDPDAQKSPRIHQDTRATILLASGRWSADACDQRGKASTTFN
jgi:hypothetical protein